MGGIRLEKSGTEIVEGALNGMCGLFASVVGTGLSGCKWRNRRGRVVGDDQARRREYRCQRLMALRCQTAAPVPNELPKILIRINFSIFPTPTLCACKDMTSRTYIQSFSQRPLFFLITWQPSQYFLPTSKRRNSTVGC